MAKIHFIWWGNPTTDQKRLDAATIGPSEVLRAVGREHEVFYWHQGSWNPAEMVASAGQGPSITSKKVELKAEQARLDHDFELGLDEAQATTLGQIFRVLDDTKAFSAVKDLMSLCVLYQEGGFYFDTSILVVDKHNLDLRLWTRAFELEEDGELRVMARYLDTQTTKLFLDISPPNIVQGNVDGKQIPGAPQIEVSAMYAPARSQAVLAMIKGYITRCVAVNIHTNELVEVVSEFFRRVLDSKDGNSEMRKRTIGNLIVQSVNDGLVFQARKDGVDQREAIGNKIKEYCWGAIRSDNLGFSERLSSGQAQYLPELGILKRSLQTWR